MTPMAARAFLDRELAAHGQTVTLRRYAGPASAPLSTWTDTPIRLKARPLAPREIVGGVFSKPAEIVCSPSDVGAAPVAIARDAIMIGPVRMVITAWSPIVVDGEVVRIEGRVE